MEKLKAAKSLSFVTKRSEEKQLNEISYLTIKEPQSSLNHDQMVTLLERFAGAYGWPKEDEKHKTWSLIRHLYEESPFSILLGGDFNEFLHYDEVEGGEARVRREIAKFREVLDDCRLRDLKFEGSCVGRVNGCAYGGENCHSCKRVRRVEQYYTLQKLGEQIANTEKSLLEAQQRMVSNRSIETFSKLEKKLDNLNEKLEAHWYIRSRVAKVRDGDKNTKYFHHRASQRKERNFIRGMLDNEDEWQTDDDKIESIIMHHFEGLFSSSDP
ncbi:uncharacterized protein LOC110683930 [Chenopodium quinoa]|uniref:uncharacterized protein LOC110683930 n=1 Tax=Chenopodium quinoa TaxID=63459 RepID=UPI000B791747|nr:uncharacterized protein LOC110683930 [Chenopodium quinoa]